MLKFKTYKSVTQLRKECKARGWKLDTRKYDKEGSDYVSIDFEIDHAPGFVLLNTFNGQFFGEYPVGRKFRYDDPALDTEPWFITLINALYVPLDEPQSHETN